MKIQITELLQMIKNNKKVIENYFFMTILLVLNSYFGLLIYPYLIKSLGKDAYGIYVFGTSIVTYFIQIVSFGFDLYGVRKISENPFDIEKKSEVVSKIFSAKIYLEFLSIIIFAILLLTIPILTENTYIYVVCFCMTFVNIIFPNWYFQGVQKMRIVSYIQLGIKLLSLPFIFLYVKAPSDLLFFTGVMTFSSVLGAIIAFIYLLKIEKIQLTCLKLPQTYDYIKESSYFFYTNIANISKTETIKIIIGARYGMGDLAIFDLAQKIISIPMALLSNINGALFPKIMLNFSIKGLKKILIFERLLGGGVVLLITIFGKYIVEILGDKGMELAYPLSIILSFTVFIFLQTGVYLYLVLLPKGYDKCVLENQIIAFITIMFCIIVGIIFSESIFILPLSLVISGVTEIIYLRYIIKKEKLLTNE